MEILFQTAFGIKIKAEIMNKVETMTQQQSVSPAIKARVLAESLPYIRRFSGSIIVINTAATP